MAQRVITGTVYREGKPAAGVTVEAHKSSESFMTSFDGKYTINADPKTKFLKFTFIDDTRKLDIEGKEGDEFDFSFDGIIPLKEDEQDVGVILKTDKELIKEGDRTFMNNLTMYDQFYRQKDYKSALGPWRILYRTYPKSIKNIYIHGCNMFEAKFEQSDSWVKKNFYIDSIMNVYDRRIKYFDEKGFVRGRQGVDYIKLKLQNENWTDDQLKDILKKGYGYLDESIKEQGDNTETPVLVVFMQVTGQLFKQGEFSKEKVLENYELASKILDKYLASEPNKKKYIESKDAVNKIFEVSGAADCEALLKIYEPKFDELSGDIEALKKVLRMLDKQDCTDSDLFAKASEKLYELEPSAEAAFNMGRLFMKRKDFAKGKDYYLQAIGSEKDAILLSKYYLELGAFTLASEQNYKEAASYLRKAIVNDPNNGKAYLILGDVFAGYSKKYGEKEIEHLSLFWLAVDYYVKAKKIDPEQTAKTNEKIATYSQYFPDKETLFFEGYQDGQPYKIGSWINETTTVRARK
jgi:tetratricopeptide (TPR) repeat protein